MAGAIGTRTSRLDATGDIAPVTVAEQTLVLYLVSVWDAVNFHSGVKQGDNYGTGHKQVSA